MGGLVPQPEPVVEPEEPELPVMLSAEEVMR